MSVTETVARLAEALRAVPANYQMPAVARQVETIVEAHRSGNAVGAVCAALSTKLIKVATSIDRNHPAWHAWTLVAHAADAVATAERRERDAQRLTGYIRDADARIAGDAATPPLPDDRRDPANGGMTAVAPDAVIEAPAAMSFVPASPWSLEPVATGAPETVGIAVLESRLAPSLFHGVVQGAEAEARGRIDLLEESVVELTEELEAHPPIDLEPTEIRALLRLSQAMRRRARRARWGWLSALLPGTGAVALAIAGIGETLAAFYAPAGLIILVLALRREYNLTKLVDGTDRLCNTLSEQLRSRLAAGEKPAS